MVYQHYRLLLDDREKKIYDKLYRGIKNFDKEIHLPRLTQKEFEKIYNYISLDNPIFFYFQECNYLLKINELICMPIYLYDQNTIDNYLAEIGRLTKVFKNTKNLNDYDFILYINALFKRKITYHDDETFVCHSVIGSMINKKAVCDGISKLFKYICDINNIYCVVVNGEAKSAYNSPIYGPHAWNKVKINGEWVHIDLTYNLTVGSQSVRHDYCFLSDDAIGRTHVVDIDDKLVCKDESLNYFVYHNLVMKNQNTLRNFLEKIIDESKNEFEFKIPKTKDIDQLTDKVFKITQEILLKKSIYKNVTIEYNLDQLIYFIRLG